MENYRLHCRIGFSFLFFPVTTMNLPISDRFVRFLPGESVCLFPVFFGDVLMVEEEQYRYSTVYFIVIHDLP